MANYRSGTVNVANANPRVSHVWQVNYTDKSGAFPTPPVPIDWSAIQDATITAATQADPVVVTSVNTYTNGASVIIYDVVGMTELNGYTFTVANATSTSFELSGVDGTGYTAYISGGTIRSSPTGIGYLVEDVTTETILRFYRTSGTLPAIGNQINSGTVASVIIESPQPGSPPRFDANLSAGNTFLTGGLTIPATLSSTITEDSFDLTENYPGIGNDSVGYTVIKDATAFYEFPKPSASSGLSNEIVAVAFDQIDTRLKEISNVEQSLGSSSGAITVDWTLGHGALFTLTENVTSVSFTNPRGPALLFLHLLQDGTGGRTITGWPSEVKFTGDVSPANSKPAIDLRANMATVMLMMFDGTNYMPMTLYPQPQYPTLTGLQGFTGTPTVDWNNGLMQRGTLTGDSVFAFTDPPGCAELTLMWYQDGTGSRTVGWPANVSWPSGTEPSWSTSANQVNLARFYYDASLDEYLGTGNPYGTI